MLLSDPDRPELVVQAARGYGEIVGKRIPIGEGVTGHVAKTGEPLLVRDTHAEPRYLPGVAGGASEMAVPLKLYGRVLGVLDVTMSLADADRGIDQARNQVIFFNALSIVTISAIVVLLMMRFVGEPVKELVDRECRFAVTMMGGIYAEVARAGTGRAREGDAREQSEERQAHRSRNPDGRSTAHPELLDAARNGFVILAVVVHGFQGQPGLVQHTDNAVLPLNSWDHAGLLGRAPTGLTLIQIWLIQI